MKETTNEYIMRKTGKKPVECKCQLCKMQCAKAPCIGTPADIEAIIKAGYGDRIVDASWAAGIMFGCMEVIDIFMPEQLPNGACAFFKDGLCELHDKGLKPIEGRLSFHTATIVNRYQDSISYNTAKTWTDEEFKRIEKLKNDKEMPVCIQSPKSE